MAEKQALNKDSRCGLQLITINFRMAARDTKAFSLDSVVRGRHLYKCLWTPIVVEELLFEEPNNPHDRGIKL